MKQILKLLWLCTVFSMFRFIAPAQHKNIAPAPYVPGELIVKFKEGNAAAKANQLITNLQAKVIQTIPSLGIEVWKINQANTKQNILELVERYKDYSDIEFIEPNYLYSISGAKIVNDPKFGQQWALHNAGELEGAVADADIDAPEAWKIQSDTSTIVIGILDTGVDWRHPDLIDNIWQNLAEDADGDGVVLEKNEQGKWVFDPGDVNGIDDDGNGYIDDFIGWNFVDKNNKPFDYDAFEKGEYVQSHGTHVAGIIAASHNNIGIAGVAPNVKIAPLKFLNDNVEPTGEGKHAVAAINYAVSMGTQISNNCWGGNAAMNAIRLAIQNAKNENHLFVASAGNEGKKSDNHFPAGLSFTNIISVANTNSADSLAKTSNYNYQKVHIAAPGKNIISCLPYDTLQYGYMSGTSMAAPLVSGASALLWQKQLDSLGAVKHQNIKQLLLDNVDVTPHLLNKSYSGGRLNLYKALLAATDTNYAEYRKQDSITLRAIYNALNGPNWEVYESGQKIWDIDNKPINEWGGVLLNEFGRVEQLTIKYKSLSGTIPPQIGNLSDLKSLSINSGAANYSATYRISNTSTQENIIDPYLNNTEYIGFNGGYQNVTGAIPKEIGNLTKLRYISLEALKLAGEIPVEIANLKHLLTLNLSGNQLTGNIPVELTGLTKLSYLNIGLNKLSGTIPPEFSDLKNLGGLNLFYNQLEGSIPESIGYLPLRTIDLGYNTFDRNIPKQVGTFQFINHLFLDHNRLAGSIPPNLGRLDAGTLKLNLSNNQLSGCYDPSLILTGSKYNEYGYYSYPCSYDYRCLIFTNEQISDGNNFDAAWEDFVIKEAGSCWASEISKVWPGDLNNDGEVSRDDIIFYGLAKGIEGPARVRPTEYGLDINNIGNTNWEAQLCPRWQEATFGVNSKHQDANGDGIVDTLDYLVVLYNMGLKNPNYNESGQLRYVSEGFQLILEPIEGSQTKTQKAYDLYLKKIDNSAASIYGISSSIKFNLPLDTAYIDFSNSCLDTLHSIRNFHKAQSVIEFALTQIDNVNVTCEDVLGRIIVNVDEAFADTGGQFITFKVEAISSQANTIANREINETIGATAYSSVSVDNTGNANLGISLNLSPQTCFSNGAASAGVYGGLAPYQFLWSTGQTTEAIENLDAGNYSLTVTDADSSSIVVPFEIENEIILEYDSKGDLVECQVETEIIEIEVEVETPCPDYIDFDENIVDETNHIMESGIYQASIYLKTDAKILNGENVILKAGEIIELQHGFSIELDSKLDVEIEDCNKEE